jgi:hypothetical protein
MHGQQNILNTESYSVPAVDTYSQYVQRFKELTCKSNTFMMITFSE